MADEPDWTTHRLYVWADPEARSRRDVSRLLPIAPGSFGPSPLLGKLIDRLQSPVGMHAFGVDIDWPNTDAPDRLVVLAVRRDTFDDRVQGLTILCRELRLTLFDPEEGRVLSSSRRPRMPSPRKATPAVALIRRVSEGFELSGDGADDARRLNARVEAATGGALLESLLPSQVRLPFVVPESLRFAIPVAVPTDRQTPSLNARLLVDLKSDSPNVRRAAAFDLGGWAPSGAVDAALAIVAGSDQDMYVRAVAVLALAIRRGLPDADLIGFATDVISGEQQPSARRFATLAQSIALLAATIVAVRSTEPRCEGVAAMAHSVARIPAERTRAQALVAILSEHCS